ncbi:ribonuclease Z [Desulfonema magnum]|uniref:Ribonuclease n=1 Tax=Desulfonema magnum TaxID=45655 RepID=A0A975BV15_9BACT|nr:MBL fold metallo-hydrolase [Desulfonema magnum]QTA92286.1 Ribonuclease [Desulfonema magnum]
MRPSFYPRLVNGPFDDPGLFISFLFENRAILFDLGDIYSLSARDILKISHVFVSHTHMDHFGGFDRLLRLFLGREKKIHLYGPEDFLKNVEGKLAGYSWNLVENFTNHLVLRATEIHPTGLMTQEYLLHNKFQPVREAVRHPFDKILLKEPALSVSTVILDHRIPCLGFSMKERFHVNIIKENLADLGLDIGPWLKVFKQALFNSQDPDSVFEVRIGKKNILKKKFLLGELTDRIAIITPGQKITYITDVVYNPSNAAKITEFAKDSDQLFIEGTFLEKDRDIARQKYHLTAWQAGVIAARANVKQFTLFHFSPRHTGLEHILRKEAEQAASETRYQ